MRKRDKSRIQAVKMKFLRLVIGWSILDRFRNEEIREELEIYNLNEKTDLDRRNWKDHLERMDDRRLPNAASRYKPAGRRSVDRSEDQRKDENKEINPIKPEQIFKACLLYTSRCV